MNCAENGAIIVEKVTYSRVLMKRYLRYFKHRLRMSSKCRRIALATFMFSWVCLACVYFTFIKHPPADEILGNQALAAGISDSELDPSHAHTIAEISKTVWDKWLLINKFVPIGTIFDSCENEDGSNRDEIVTLGKIVLLPDPDTGGIKSLTYMNTTWEEMIPYGYLHVVVHYNTKEFYKNKFYLCDIDGDSMCPIKEGDYYIRREEKISSFLPKGTYEVDMKVEDHNKKIILCSFVSLTI